MRGRDLLAAGATTPPPDVNLWSWAVVTDDSPLRIRLDADDDPLDITPDTLKSGLAVGNRVWVQLITNDNPSRRYRRIIIHGKAGG